MMRDDKGVSVIIGAMLLILITIVAAAGLAIIISKTQVQYANKLAYDNAVSSENLKINGIELNKSLDRPGYIDNVNITLQNLNTNYTNIVAVYLNEEPASQFYISGANGQGGISGPYDITDPYKIESGGSVKLIVNVSADLPVNLWANKTLTVKVITRYVNTFNVTYKTPSPIVKSSIETRTFNGISKDYLVLDGSGSTDERSIVQYNWTIFDPASLQPKQLIGKIVQFAPNSSGPFVVKLTVINDIGLEMTTNNYTIPYNPGFNSQQLSITPYITGIQDNGTYWGLDVDVANVMSDPVQITNVNVNGIDAVNFSTDAQLNITNLTVNDKTRIHLNFTLNFSNQFNLSRTERFSVQVNTSFNNTFKKTIEPPTAFAKVSVQTQDLGNNVKQDYLTLDGSSSYSNSNDITGWTWTIKYRADGSIEQTKTGRITPPIYLNTQGPYDVYLNVTDTSGLNSTPQTILIPYNSNFVVPINTPIPTPTATPIPGGLPNAVAKVTVQTQDLGNNIKRDYLVLDGSGSTTITSITNWIWTINNTNTGLTEQNLTGMKIQAFLQTNDPYNISLVVINSTGVTSDPVYVYVQSNQNFDPVANIVEKLPRTGSNITVQVFDIVGLPVNGAMVSFMPLSGNLTLERYYSSTNSTGVAMVNVTSGSGSVHVIVNNVWRDINYP